MLFLSILLWALMVSAIWLLAGFLLCYYFIMPLFIKPIEAKLHQKPKVRDAFGDIMLNLCLGPLGWCLFLSSKLQTNKY